MVLAPRPRSSSLPRSAVDGFASPTSELARSSGRSSADHDSLRLSLGEGQHIFACRATGSGKTTTMRRVLAARTFTQKAALLILDQKGDEEDVEQMSRLAAAAEVLHAADKWPPSVPFLIDACHPLHYDALTEIAQKLGDRHRDLIRRVEEHGKYVSPRGTRTSQAARLGCRSRSRSPAARS